MLLWMLALVTCTDGCIVRDQIVPQIHTSYGRDSATNIQATIKNITTTTKIGPQIHTNYGRDSATNIQATIIIITTTTKIVPQIYTQAIDEIAPPNRIANMQARACTQRSKEISLKPWAAENSQKATPCYTHSSSSTR